MCQPQYYTVPTIPHSWSLSYALTPVACSANMEEGLVKVIMCYDVPGRVEEWHIPRKTASKWVWYRLQTWTIEHWALDIRQSWQHFLGSKSQLQSCTEGMCHSSTCPDTSLHVTQFYQAFLCVSTASSKCWSQKAWVLLLQCLHHGQKIYYLCIIFFTHHFLLMESHLIASVPIFKPLSANVVQLTATC